jgi:hypothetical protein
LVPTKLHGDLDAMEIETRRLINGLLKIDALPVRFVGTEKHVADAPLPPSTYEDASASMLLPSENPR